MSRIMKHTSQIVKHALQGVVVLLVGLSGTLHAQISHTSSGLVDKNAERILKLAEQKFNTGSVAFSVDMVALDDAKKETARHTAKIVYRQGKYKADVGQQSILCDGTTIWQHNKQANEVVVNSVTTGGDDLMNPGQLLKDYEKNFRAKFIRTDPDGTAVVDLMPKQPKSYHKVRLLINEKSGLLKRLTMHNYDGSEASFAVSGFRSTKTSDADFVFDVAQHKGVEVIDMR